MIGADDQFRGYYVLRVRVVTPSWNCASGWVRLDESPDKRLFADDSDYVVILVSELVTVCLSPITNSIDVSRRPNASRAGVER